jgi:hypothetical protein
VELARAEDGKHHKLVEIRAAALDTDLSANGGRWSEGRPELNAEIDGLRVRAG